MRANRGTWVVVANAYQAQVWSQGDGDVLLERVHDGRFYNPAAQVNAGSELIGAGTLHPATAHAFARLIADYLYRAACAGQFSRLVLAAPDAILLSLQQEFPRRVVRQVASIVAQDLTHLDPGALARSLAAVLPQ